MIVLLSANIIAAQLLKRQGFSLRGGRWNQLMFRQMDLLQRRRLPRISGRNSKWEWKQFWMRYLFVTADSPSWYLWFFDWSTDIYGPLIDQQQVYDPKESESPSWSWCASNWCRWVATMGANWALMMTILNWTKACMKLSYCQICRYDHVSCQMSCEHPCQRCQSASISLSSNM